MKHLFRRLTTGLENVSVCSFFVSLSAHLERTVKMTLWWELLGHVSSNLPNSGFRWSFGFRKKLQSTGWISPNFKLVTTYSSVKTRKKLHGNFCLKARTHCRVALLKQDYALHQKVEFIWEFQWQSCSCVFEGILTERLCFSSLLNGLPLFVLKLGQRAVTWNTSW